ncbi:MAG TPA: diguanylate cyclase [Clostridia bacterium]|nr:diguanylate cyclase [Clostridia bacterium]
MLCNAFLFFTLLTAKKTQVVYAFMALLVAFVTWTSGSLFMRLELYPNMTFWFEVSFAGICIVPYLYFILACALAGEKATFLKIVWGICTLAILVGNYFDFFISHPIITTSSGERVFDYQVHLSTAILIAIAVGILSSAAYIFAKSIKSGTMSRSQVRPLVLGVVCGFLLTVSDIIPISFIGSLPLDTLATSVNAVFIYYALYKKRMYALSQITSRGSSYLVSVLLTTLVLIYSFNPVNKLFVRYFGAYLHYQAIAVSILYAIMSIAIFSLFNLMHNSLFVKEQVAREDKLKNFSLCITKTLKLDEIISAYIDFLRESISASQIYVCLHSPEENCYRSTTSALSLSKRFVLRDDNSLVLWMKEYSKALLYTEFTRQTQYKSMWEAEKQALQGLGVSLVLPVECDSQLVGLTFLTDKHSHKPYSYDEISFLESVASIVSIAIKNANLYETIHKEAQRDSLTGLYNRRYFNKQLEEDFECARAHSITVILFNLDDFRLYNELYGSGEGDCLLSHFAGILQAVVGNKGTVARYGGKEFAVSLPFSCASDAEELAGFVKQSFSDYLSKESGPTQKFLTFSAGICSYPTSAASPDQLLSYANLAVYSVKKNGKNGILTYTRTASTQPEYYNERSKAAIVQEYTATIYALTAAIDAKDHYTFSHSQCVSSYASQLALAAGLSDEHVEIIRQAGLLHDIGKIGIPDSILTKEGKLTSDEHGIMRRHVERSIEMIRHLPSLDYVIPVVLSHHERYDGKGYPRGIAGENIPIGARCLSIVDSFDAMVSRRSYKETIPINEALDEIRSNLGKQFDPELGQLFVSLVENYQIKAVSY